MTALRSLNPEQQKAVLTQGPVVIIAGPGTGKTQTLIARIEYLMEEKKILPPSILALTFTNKAASEIKERLKQYSHLPSIFTFHGLAFDVLSHLQKKPLEVLTEAERINIITEAICKTKGKLPNDKEIQALSVSFSKEFEFDLHENISLMRATYEELKKEKGKYDYEDLLILFKEQITKKASQSYDYILVDEFQDTNKLQYEIVKLLLATDNIFVIGDPYQSIYKFRGSDAAIFQHFQKDFPSNTLITLQSNYRSCSAILRVSDALYKDKRELKNEIEREGDVYLLPTVNEYTEADWVKEKICELVGGTDLLQGGEMSHFDKKSHFSEIAVIYRTHAVRRLIAKKLQESGIPYQVIGSDSFFEQPEIKFILDVCIYLAVPSKEQYLSLFASPIIPLSNVIKKEITIVASHTVDQEKLRDQIKEICKRTKSAMHILSTVNEFISSLIVSSKTIGVEKVIHNILTFPYLKSRCNNKSFQDDVKQLLSISYRYKTLSEFYQEILKLRERDYYEAIVERVTLMTIHASKGLEFDHVFIPSFENGSIPSTREDADLSEERNLFYVALTRARENVFLITPQQRNGKSTTESSFLNDIEKYIHILNDTSAAFYLKRKDKQKQKKSQLTIF